MDKIKQHILNAQGLISKSQMYRKDTEIQAAFAELVKALQLWPNQNKDQDEKKIENKKKKFTFENKETE